MKRVLILASVASMIDQFNMPNIRLLQEMGYAVDVACNFKEGSTCSDERVEDLKRRLKKSGVRCYQIDFARDITNIGRNVRAFWQVEHLLEKNSYTFLHCHSPIGGVVGRLAGKKTHTKVIYTAHGFHFYKGAPLKNWLLYYPVEKLCSFMTDVIITINHEDYERARDKFHMKKVVYIPGVGVDTHRFRGCTVSKAEKRKELSIPDDAFVLLSVGELSDRKNHFTVLEALAEVNDGGTYYLIAGKGHREDKYREFIKKQHMEDRVKLLGPRDDVDELCVAADVFVHPSIREGLGIAPLEGMAAGLPLISAYINGMKDYTEDGRTGCCISDPTSVSEIVRAIKKMRDEPGFRKRCGEYNQKVAEQFDVHMSEEVTRCIYEGAGGYYHLIRSITRHELGLSASDVMLFSVGEVNDNKNHIVIIEALGKIHSDHLHYFIAGQGDKENELKEMARKLGVADRTHFLGYREDIVNLLKAADIFCFPSKREGLGIAAIEAMASGLPLVTSNVHGIKDYSINGTTGQMIAPLDANGFAIAIKKLINLKHESICRYNSKAAKNYDQSIIKNRMEELYGEM